MKERIEFDDIHTNIKEAFVLDVSDFKENLINVEVYTKLTAWIREKVLTFSG